MLRNTTKFGIANNSEMRRSLLPSIKYLPLHKSARLYCIFSQSVLYVFPFLFSLSVFFPPSLFFPFFSFLFFQLGTCICISSLHACLLIYNRDCVIEKDRRVYLHVCLCSWCRQREKKVYS